MVGRSLDAFFSKEASEQGEVVLEAHGLTRSGVFDDVSFSLHAGEVLGFAGLVGAGRSEVARAIFGVDRLDAGELLLRGRRVRITSPAAAVRNGIAYVPEDRHSQGAVLELSIAANIALPNLRKLSRMRLASRRRENALARNYFTQLQIRAQGPEQRVAALSGGNQQKVVLAKWLSTQPSILILDEPTHGIDVATKAEVHRLISQLANEGMAIVLISSELPEILAMSDRVLVFREGALVAHLSREEATAERVMFAATGQEGEAVA
jgi:rhamnose transport system ATP-binding protein